MKQCGVKSRLHKKCKAPGEGQTVLAGMEVRVKETGKCIENSIDKIS